NTINEYPLFSFLRGDSHAHVLVCFNQLFFLCLMAVMLARWKLLGGRKVSALHDSCAVGWDDARDELMGCDDVCRRVSCPRCCDLADARTQPPRCGVPLALVPVLSLASYAPFLYTIQSGGGSSVQGFFLVTTPSPINEFLGVYLFFVAVFVIYGFSVLKKYPWLIAVPVIFAVAGYASAGVALFCILLLAGKRSAAPEVLFGILGMAIVFLMEFIYLKNYMGDVNYRMNTVFKFGFCAWFMLGTSVLLMIGRYGENWFAEIPKGLAAAVAAVIFVVLAALIRFCGIQLGYPGGTLDGSAWLESHHLADAADIAFLTSTTSPSDIVVEAADGSYAYNGRVSAMTGLPMIVGWVGHESGWRSGVGDAGTRWTDVRNIYEGSVLDCFPDGQIRREVPVRRR
ncbi:MAG: DUF2298 domain-containing protein, partial [Methanocorpusculum sp.]|nr:DUF2298 domain-containing protein [Methanocorpusculum sp.]